MDARHSGTVHYEGMVVVETHKEGGQLIVITATARSSSRTRRGATASAIRSSTVRFKDIIEGMTVHEEVDEVTGLSRFIIVDSPHDSVRLQPDLQT